MLLGVTEVALRLAGFAPPRPAALAPQYSKFVPDDELIWTLKPDWQGFELDDTPLSHGSLGLRGPEPAPRERIDTRVLFLGDSVTYGHHLVDDDTVPRRLEDDIAARTGRLVEVINAGVPGYSTFQSVGQLRRLGPELQPDVILLGFCLNDVTERYTALAGYGGGRFFMMNVDTAGEAGLLRRLWMGTALRQGLIAAMRLAAGKGETYRLQRLWETPEAPALVDAWSTVFREIDELAGESRRLDAALAVIIYPHARQVEATYGKDAPQQRLLAHLAKRGIPALDLLGPLRDSDLRMQQLCLDPTHLSPPGARVAAGEIGAFLVENQLLPAER